MLVSADATLISGLCERSSMWGQLTCRLTARRPCISASCRQSRISWRRIIVIHRSSLALVQSRSSALTKSTAVGEAERWCRYRGRPAWCIAAKRCSQYSIQERLPCERGVTSICAFGLFGRSRRRAARASSSSEGIPPFDASHASANTTISHRLAHWTSVSLLVVSLA